MTKRLSAITPVIALVGTLLAQPVAGQDDPLRIFISVDMEGIGGVGSPSMTSSNGKDYGTARELLTGIVADRDVSITVAEMPMAPNTSAGPATRTAR